MSLMRRLAPVRGLAEQAGRTLLDALYPLECAGCGGSGKIICDRCARDLPFWSQLPVCRRMRVELAGLRQAGSRLRCGGRIPVEEVPAGILPLSMGDKAAARSWVTCCEYLELIPSGDLMAPCQHSIAGEGGYNQAELLPGEWPGAAIPYSVSAGRTAVVQAEAARRQSDQRGRQRRRVPSERSSWSSNHPGRRRGHHGKHAGHLCIRAQRGRRRFGLVSDAGGGREPSPCGVINRRSNQSAGRSKGRAVRDNGLDQRQQARFDILHVVC